MATIKVVADSDSWPKDPSALDALVALVVADIQESEPRDVDALLEQFARVAWPSARSQRQ